MKKYVSKEDVEKGLVDPTKPLTDQKDYLHKIQQEDKKKQQHYKPKPDHPQRKERENRPKYNWNRRDVTEETVVPEAPKKEIPKPDKDKYYENLNALKKQIEKLNEEKNKIVEEMRSTMKNTSESKKNSWNTKTKFSGLLGQKHEERKSLQSEIKLLEERRDDLDRELNQKKSKINTLRKPQNFEDYSQEQLARKLELTEQRLTTADLTKKQENQINTKILEIKRVMQKCKLRTQTEINGEINLLLDQDNLIFKQFMQVKDTIFKKVQVLKTVKAELTKLHEELETSEKSQPVDLRTPDEIKADFDKKFAVINDKKDKIKKQIEKLRTNFDKSIDEYEDYNDLVSYIKLVQEEKEKIKNRKLQQERIKKEKEEAEKKRQQEYEERQRKREEKIKKDEERRKQVQERKQKLQKEREDFISRNPHHEKIDMCNLLIDYCESLKPENVAKNLVKREQKVVQPILELKPTDSKDWEKELKKGAQVIVSKKFKEEEEAPKKPQKEKKKKDAPETSSTGFNHTIDITRMFDTVNLLPPSAVTELDETIKQIRERIELFNKPTEDEIKAFKEKAGREFDEMNGIQEERGKRNYKQREGEEEHQHHEHKPKETPKEKTRKNEKVQISTGEKDFPGLN